MDLTIRGLFVGLATLDVVYLVGRHPDADEKITALDFMSAAGGPAANAAVAFRRVGGTPRLASVFGQDPFANFIVSELDSVGVACWDAGLSGESLPVSSAIVQREPARRTVVSRNAVARHAKDADGVARLISEANVLLLDGHYPELAFVAGREANRLGIPVILDGGSWKPGIPHLLPFIDVAVCSANFHPPDTRGPEEVLRYVQGAGVTHVAVTRGADDIIWLDEAGDLNYLPVPEVESVDTLGAGDFFHGTLAYAVAVGGSGFSEADFVTGLEFSSAVAALSTCSFGTRAWLSNPLPPT
jgi:sugar/nucleoside kinase (ribokinase family)